MATSLLELYMLDSRLLHDLDGEVIAEPDRVGLFAPQRQFKNVSFTVS